MSVVSCALSMGAQLSLCPDTLLQREIIESALIHSALPLHNEKSWNEYSSRQLASDSTLLAEKLELVYSTMPTSRAIGSADDPDYATYGRAQVSIDLKGADWSQWDRIAFDVFPMCPGMRVVNINVALLLKNDKQHRADIKNLAHLVNLRNYACNHCHLDLKDIERNSVDRLLLYVDNKGLDITTGDSARYSIANLRLLTLKYQEKTSGWDVPDDKIIYSYSGYDVHGEKSALVSPDIAVEGKDFVLLDANGQVQYRGKAEVKETAIGKFGVLDFSAMSHPGIYQLQIGDHISKDFPIASDILINSQWRVLNFIFCQRCGYPVPGVHGRCHTDLFCAYDGILLPYSGGWHDAGDLSQQTLQTAETAMALLECYQALKDNNPALAARMREEAEWGLDFVLRCRYGDGYHASSMGLLHWLDGRVGTYDDITSVRVSNTAFDNFIYAAVEAYAAMTLGHDSMMQQHLRRIAIEDYKYAIDKYQAEGCDVFTQPFEHTYSTSPSQYFATVSWASSLMYKLTGESKYAQIAVEEGDKFLKCQQISQIGDRGYSGFFFRDESCRSVMHSVHQSREQVYMQALDALCSTQPEHPKCSQWRQAMRLHGDYLLSLQPVTAPYGMIASGLYKIDEWTDSKAFSTLHQFVDEGSVPSFRQQIEKAEKVGDGYVLRRFPIWVNIYNGNNVTALAQAKAAAICGKALGDSALIDLVRQQVYWILGKNPFGQSLIYGEGDNYPQMDSFSSGEITGEMPVGIRCLDEEDVPYWPSTNNACYKEVWVSAAAKYLSLVSSL